MTYIHNQTARSSLKVFLFFFLFSAPLAQAGQVTFTLGSHEVYRISDQPDAVAENVSQALDALSPSARDDGLNVAPDGSWMVLSTQRFGCAGWSCLVRVAGDLSSAERVEVDGEVLHPKGISAIASGGDLIVYQDHAAQDHVRDLWVTTRSGDDWSSPVVLTGESPYRWHSYPAISDDGSKVVFLCGNEASLLAGTAMCEANTDGSNFHVVLTPEQGPGGDSQDAINHPDYAPDGSIVFEGTWSGEQIWRLPAGSSTPIQITPEFNNDNSPCVLPDGGIASIWLNRPGGMGLHELKIMSATGGDYHSPLLNLDIRDSGIGCGASFGGNPDVIHYIGDSGFEQGLAGFTVDGGQLTHSSESPLYDSFSANMQFSSWGDDMRKEVTFPWGQGPQGGSLTASGTVRFNSANVFFGNLSVCVRAYYLDGNRVDECETIPLNAPSVESFSASVELDPTHYVDRIYYYLLFEGIGSIDATVDNVALDLTPAEPGDGDGGGDDGGSGQDSGFITDSGFEQGTAGFAIHGGSLQRSDVNPIEDEHSLNLNFTHWGDDVRFVKTYGWAQGPSGDKMTATALIRVDQVDLYSGSQLSLCVKAYYLDNTRIDHCEPVDLTAGVVNSISASIDLDSGQILDRFSYTLILEGGGHVDFTLDGAELVLDSD